MKITISPETEDEQKYGEVVFENVFEYGLVGSLMASKVVPQDFNRSHGDTYKIYGRLEELQERLRKHHGLD